MQRKFERERIELEKKFTAEMSELHGRFGSSEKIKELKRDFGHENWFATRLVGGKGKGTS